MNKHKGFGLFALSALALWLAINISGAVLATPETTDRSLSSSRQQASDVAITVDEVVASGLSQPVQVTHAGDNTGRLFIVEQTGRVRVIKDGALLSTPFLDLGSKTTSSGERGFLGIAFHPNYAANGRFFVNYTRSSDGATIVSEIQVSASDPDRADPASETQVLKIDQPYGNHNGGQVMFGPDGYLYVGMGDGGSGGDPEEAGQDPTSLLGAMLRIDVDGATPYAIPPDNPYVGTTGRDEIWAIGLRNPWRFSFDRATGDLYIGDVGQNAWEEISFLSTGSPGGANFGWDCREGTHDYEWDAACAAATLTPPIAEYDHDEGRSVTGGFVYRGTLYPDLVGRYFYADYVNGKIWSLVQTSPGSFSVPELELDTSLQISAFGEDQAGELYVVDRSGSIRHLADVNGPALPPDLTGSRKAASPQAADPGETVTIDVTLTNSGRAVPGTLDLVDAVPAGLSYIAGSLAATAGDIDDTGAPTLTWTGTLGEQETVTITYDVQVTGAVTGGLVSVAELSGVSLGPLELATAVFVPRSVLTTTMQDTFLPGTQPGGLSVDIVNSVDCDTCHSAPIYDTWRGTMMSQAGRDPLLYAALGTANSDAPNAGDYCLRCHVPKGWLEGRSHPADGSALTQTDIDNGIACALCHRAVDPLPTGGEAAGIDVGVRNALTATVPITYVGSGTLIVDDADNRRGPFSFTPDLPYHTAYQTTYLGQATAPEADAVTRARFCGTCHDVDNPVLSWDEGRGQYWPNAMDTAPEVVKDDLFPIERTYTEWRNSAYPAGVTAPAFAGDKPDDIVAACQDCHMERQSGTAADSAFNPVTRDCTTPESAGGAGCLPEHGMVGGNTWVPLILQNPDWRLTAEGDAAFLNTTAERARSMLSRAATLTATLVPSGTEKAVVVRVTNETGHKLPTGYPEGRQMWLHVRAYDAAGALVYESGRYDTATHTLVRDGDVRVYEAKQGITPDLAAIVGKPAGPSFHFILNNTVVKDNRIPPRGYNTDAWDRPGLRPVGAMYADGQYWDEVIYAVPGGVVRTTVTLHYQTAASEYIDFLRRTGGVDGEALYDLWTQSPSPPVVMAIASDPSLLLYMPIIARES